VWLCTDAAQGVSGQTFVAGSDGVWWFAPFTQQASVRNGGRAFTVAELADRVGELFGDRDTAIPPFAAPAFHLA
jgi:hypothetical protein